MQWQNPWAWLGLLTLVLPILVHLFSRRQTRIEPFPTLRFIDMSRLLPTRRTQITDVLLLFVRLLILAVAVAALAQPLFRNRAASSAVASALIVDTMAVGSDNAARATLDRALSEVNSASATQLRMDIDTPVDALAGAKAWLATQTGGRQLVIVSDFRDGTLDSLDLTLLPRDISVRLVPAGDAAARVTMPSAGAVGQTPRGEAVWLASSAPASDNVRTAVNGAVRALGASALVDSVAASARRVIVVAPSDADSLAAWLNAARPASGAWMADVMVRLRSDTTLVTASASASVSDTTVAAPFTVIARTSSNAPVVAVASLGGAAADTAAATRMLVWTRTSADALTTASVLLAASRAVEQRAGAKSGRAMPDSAQLRRWEKAPAAAPAGIAYARASDALTGASDARWFWVAVLVLLGVETVIRQRIRSGGSMLGMPDAVPGSLDA